MHDLRQAPAVPNAISLALTATAIVSNHGNVNSLFVEQKPADADRFKTRMSGKRNEEEVKRKRRKYMFSKSIVHFCVAKLLLYVYILIRFTKVLCETNTILFIESRINNLLLICTSTCVFAFVAAAYTNHLAHTFSMRVHFECKFVVIAFSLLFIFFCLFQYERTAAHITQAGKSACKDADM